MPVKFKGLDSPNTQYISMATPSGYIVAGGSNEFSLHITGLIVNGLNSSSSTRVFGRTDNYNSYLSISDTVIKLRNSTGSNVVEFTHTGSITEGVPFDLKVSRDVTDNVIVLINDVLIDSAKSFNYAFSFNSIAAVSVSSDPSNSDPIQMSSFAFSTTGGAVEYLMTEGSGSTLTDTSGYDYHGTLENYTADQWVAASPSAPTITGPDSTTEGSATVQSGTLQDTITTQSLISGGYSIEQTIDSATAGTLTYNAESGVNQCTPSTPVSGVPLEPTITAAGITPYVVQQEADDGTNPPATRDITLNPEATHDVIQTMAGVANTNPDQSIFGSTWVTVEDNHQARLPKVADGVTFTWSADGTFTTDQDKTVTFQYELFSPASGNWSAIDITVKSVQGVGVVVTGVDWIIKRVKRKAIKSVRSEIIKPIIH